MRTSDWSSDVCSSDLPGLDPGSRFFPPLSGTPDQVRGDDESILPTRFRRATLAPGTGEGAYAAQGRTARRRKLGHYGRVGGVAQRSEEHKSELQSLLRISFAVFCLK